MSGKIVVKMGGSTLDSENVLVEFAEAVALAADDNRIAVVHGGGKDIGRQLDRMGREFKFIDGLRVTDDETIDVVEMVLSGLVNKWITRALEIKGLKAAGVSGTDLGLFRAVKLESKSGDLGYVGSIEDVNTELVDILVDRGVIPVISPISIGPGGRAYNVNADHAARSSRKSGARTTPSTHRRSRHQGRRRRAGRNPHARGSTVHRIGRGHRG